MDLVVLSLIMVPLCALGFWLSWQDVKKKHQEKEEAKK